MIKALKDETGQWHLEDIVIGNIFLDHFQKLSTLTPINIHILENIPIKYLDETQIHKISMPILDLEIYKATIQFGQWKIPGPNGLPVGFSVENWETFEVKICWSNL